MKSDAREEICALDLTFKCHIMEMKLNLAISEMKFQSCFQEVDGIVRMFVFNVVQNDIL